MIWLYRYILNLPARPEDIQEIKREFPEILQEGFTKNKISGHGFIDIDLSTFGSKIKSHFHGDIDDLFKGLENWLKDVKQESIEKNNSCPLLDECPQYKDNNSSNNENILKIMTIGGGPNASPPKKSFEDLITKTFTEKDKIVKVILTDPYILANSNDGEGNSLDNLKSFLNLIITDKNKSFSLCIQPRMKKSDSAYKSFCDSIIKEYKSINIESFNSKFKFHDRFYICKYKDGNYKGVFGPSINGLGSNSIILFGEIENEKSLKKIKEWFD